MAQHLSVRVPWKDNGYSGLICDKPCYNNACLRLSNIADSRNDELEDSLRGCPILGHEMEIPCLSEGGCFMSADTYRKITVHPYKKATVDRTDTFLKLNWYTLHFPFPQDLFHGQC